MQMKRVGNTLRGLLQAYGPEHVKRHLWNSEFSRGRWNCLDETPGDCVYPFVEKYANHGSILDLGCGSGSTGNELNRSAYEQYTGVDISEVAIDKARRRTAGANRPARTHNFVSSDIFSYVPCQKFDCILFRDSIYYIPRARIARMLDRYSPYLRPGGVFIVRMANGTDKYQPIVETIASRFEVVGRHLFEQPPALVLIFRPPSPTAKG